MSLCVYLSGPDIDDRQDGDRCAEDACALVRFPGCDMHYPYCTVHLGYALKLSDTAELIRLGGARA